MRKKKLTYEIIDPSLLNEYQLTEQLRVQKQRLSLIDLDNIQYGDISTLNGIFVSLQQLSVEFAKRRNTSIRQLGKLSELPKILRHEKQD